MTLLFFIRFTTADDANLICLSNSIKKWTEIANADLEHPVNWLNANKISLSVTKS